MAAHAPSGPPVLLTDKEGRQLPPDEALDEALPEYRAPGRKSLQEIQQLDPDDKSLAKYKRALLGPGPPAAGMLRPRAGSRGRMGAPCGLPVSPQTPACPTCR